MNKRITYIFLILMLSILGIVCSAHRARYSPFTMRFLHELDKARAEHVERSDAIILSEKMMKQFLVKEEDHGYIVHGVIEVAGAFDESALTSWSVRVRSRHGNFWSVVIPIESLKHLGDIRGVLRIEIDTPVKKR